MTRGAGVHRSRLPIKDRRAERELFFWTAQQTLKLVMLAALTVYAVVALVEGRLPGAELLLHYF
jgi:hypothetical protein